MTMTPSLPRLGRIIWNGVGFVLALSAFACASAQACTIFVMTDGKRVLFCNNEDWSNPNTKVWFVPGAGGRHGAAYVDFEAAYQEACRRRRLA
jgi:hypothetical protein